MAIGTSEADRKGRRSRLHLLDGTTTSNSYAAVARRGDIFLGIKPTGLMDGTKLGLSGKTYLHARVRSARDAGLAEKLGHPTGKVVSLFDENLTPDAAWPNFTFEKIDDKRASLVLGLFISASLHDDLSIIVRRIEKGALVRKVADFVIETAGPQYCIAEPPRVAAWLADQLKSVLEPIKKAVALQEAAQATQKEFEAAIENQLEVVGAFGQQLCTLFHKHQQVLDALNPPP